MKKKIVIVLASFIMTGAGILFQPGEALSHDINVSFGINIAPPPPAVVVTRPPALHVIPGTPVYYVPEVERQLYFYSDNWYRLYDGYWFRAAYNNGPWMYLSPSNVPFVFRTFHRVTIEFLRGNNTVRTGSPTVLEGKKQIAL